MALLGASNASVYFGSNKIFEGVTFEVQSNDRIGLIGINGSGKTTLFKLITGEYSTTEGEIYISKNTKIGYMEQHTCRNLDITAYDEVLTVFEDIFEMERQIELLAKQISENPYNTNELIEKQSFLNDEFQRNDGLTCRARARSALLGLSFSDEEMQLKIGELSGGQRAKVQLAKMLLSNANLLLLDEPTNHLDTNSVEWLEDYLRNSKTAYIVISHDRYFLDKVANKIFEIEHKKLVTYKGNYSAYLPQKEERKLAAQRVYDNTKKEIERLEGIVAQQRQWNREKNIRTAESKLKVIDRLEQNLEKPENTPESLKFKFSVKSISGEDVLDISDLSLSFGDKEIFKNVNISVKRGDRIFILGKNGCGKTSLLKTILKKYHQTNGRIKTGIGVLTGYYDQIQQGIDSNKTVLQELWDKYPYMTQTQLRNALAQFLFYGDDVFKEISSLSGGERARLILLELMQSGCNLLLLDEPTNHLDIASCEALEEALKCYEGTLIVVSHDRYLINKLATKLYYLSKDGATEFEGNYEYFLEKFRPFEQITAVKADNTDRINEYKQKKEKASQFRKLKTRVSKTETEIANTEIEISNLEKQLMLPEVAENYEKIIEITNLMNKKRQSLDCLYEQWEKLEIELSNFEDN